ncbi:MAG: glyceraldehyde 3-phosphate dehydrogenase NAD-binding domain-containing protein [Pseudomonadota bacterium]
MKPIRIGLMGFGQVGRQIYRLALADERFEVVAISDIGKPEILLNLLTKSRGRKTDATLSGNYLVAGGSRARLMSANLPNEIPWDVFGVDVVVDATGIFRSRDDLAPHIGNGAHRVITSVLPIGELDRVVLYGVNNDQAVASDRIVSAGSASTTASALLLRAFCERWPLEQASMTSVHAYTSDQSLQDYAGPDIRRSRSGAENIIPNSTPAREWVERTLPELGGRFSAYALNVPVQVGSLLDITVVTRDSAPRVEEANVFFEQVAAEKARLLATTRDPIVSSDVRGTTQSLIVDLDATMRAGSKMLKLIAWHETLGHAQRILDVAGLYALLDANRLAEAS